MKAGGFWAAAILSAALAAGAIGKSDKLDGFVHAETIEPAAGFVDTPSALDGGSRLAYVISDAAGKSVVNVRDLASATELESFSLAPLRGEAIAVAFTSRGLFVTGRDKKGQEIGAIFESGKLSRRFGPATRVRLSRLGEAEVVSIYKLGKSGKNATHTVEARNPATGKRVGKKTTLKLDAGGRDAKRGFVLNHWQSEHLVAVGIHEGQYSREADQRMPDQAGRLDMTSGEVARSDITDLIKHRQRQIVLAGHSNEARFVTYARDRKSLRVYEDGEPRVVDLAEPLRHYDPASLVYSGAPAGPLFFSLRIDPVHPDAAAQKRAVPAWFDLYALERGEAKPRRIGRVLSTESGAFSWIASNGFLVAMPEHVGFSRGGPRLEIYSVAPKQPISKNK